MLLPGLLLCGIPKDTIAAEDELNCLLCHKHRGLSRVEKDGDFRLFYINEELFADSPHSRNECKDCHSDIDRIPHDPSKGVDCTRECHMLEPSGKQKFSHKFMAEELAKSVHGRLKPDGTPKPNQEDYPGCKDCHDEPLFRPLSFYKGEEIAGVSQRGITRCKSCHKTGDFAESFYKHVTSRLHKTRSPKEMIRVCAKCHEDRELNKRHELDDTIHSYKETFHYKLIALGSETTPDCIDCHVVVGENPHLIESKETKTSSVFKKNVPTTCRASECHEKAGANLAGFQTHVTYSREKYPLQFYMLIFFKSLLAVVMYFFLTYVFLELMRRLFPDFSFNRQEWAMAKARRKIHI
ncbi:MAG: hypothetical protein A2W28_11730 [Gammaproteobacteria bacterium RBG_16_51_14]|nr:MAG: hypothetical protein A2W28_11730 [Gammaproteobacteria bacterium RBG_16_51_14]